MQPIDHRAVMAVAAQRYHVAKRRPKPSRPPNPSPRRKRADQRPGPVK